MHHHSTHAWSPRRNRRFLTSSRTLVLLAPSGGAIPGSFTRVCHDFDRYYQLLQGVQSLRAAVYLKDGAIHSSHLLNGRHRQTVDYGSWHLLLLDETGQEICGCARYRQYPAEHTEFSQLTVARSALASCSQWGSRLRSSVSSELQLSRKLRLPYVELGGWALRDDVRGSTEAIRMALSTYGLAQLTGGGVGISTATHRNGSASILGRLGGQPLTHDDERLPAYFDPQYACDMEILRFYSWTPNPRYESSIEDLKQELRDVLVITDRPSSQSLQFRHGSAVLPANAARRSAWGPSRYLINSLSQ